MKLYTFLILSIAFISISCKCNCDGGIPVISSQNEKLIPFKNDTIIDFINTKSNTVKFYVSTLNNEEVPRNSCMFFSNLFSKNCICPSDHIITNGFIEQSYSDSISFSIQIVTNENSSNYSYSLNQNYFFQFDSTNISKTINNRLYTGLSLKEFTNSRDSISRIYYKDSLGLVSVVYKNGKTVDLK